ncbi:DUF2589 domain-containing protein [Streptomyces sp. DSM 44917]|uniref:DUF2589 domain-containing protein n=1 Tax=Streptomyces boetiae TaxID=3075541 RepID=A0ABU2L2K8_9ACTN|nr:DUF2589 domain-containing protein [Streptomyces sp. DSM 44917]MDT0305792.1 DUF2589 domain-containing protein [Streptomyces sp. DSM 44917]
MPVGDELSGLDFSAMIGGPLSAVVKAQAQSAQTSVEFIRSVGFGQDGQPTTVQFSYEKPVEKRDDNGRVSGVEVKPFKLSVPILTMLPIPFIRIQETTIDFNAKINSVQESSSTSSQDLAASLGASGGFGPVSAELKVSYSSKQGTSEGSKVERSYSMAVQVKATQEELPAGTERILSVLENCIKESPA